MVVIIVAVVDVALFVLVMIVPVPPSCGRLFIDCINWHVVIESIGLCYIGQSGTLQNEDGEGDE